MKANSTTLVGLSGFWKTSYKGGMVLDSRQSWQEGEGDEWKEYGYGQWWEPWLSGRKMRKREREGMEKSMEKVD